MQEKIWVLDMGSEYTQLIARKIRRLNVYCEIYPYNDFPTIDDSVKGVILSGSIFNVGDELAPLPDLSNIRGKLPLLGVCYGANSIAYAEGGVIATNENRDYIKTQLHSVAADDTLMKGVAAGSTVYLSYRETIVSLPENYKPICATADVEIAGFHIEGENSWGIQFHPELPETESGDQILINFIETICGCERSWSPETFAETLIAEARAQVGDEKVILALSGGVDSSVVAALLHRAIGDNLTCIFVDHGLLRKNEFINVQKSYQGLGLNVIAIDASQRFLDKLADVSDPERKRKIIGKEFIDVFEEEARKVEGAKWLGQGTIYPDVIESYSVKGPNSTIKSHHNVGGLPEKMNLKVIEPLRLLFKDEVRKVGKTLGLPSFILNRHPFPGPGLAIRCLGAVSKERLDILRDADEIFVRNLQEAGLYDKVWQAIAILLPVKTVGVRNDERTYENALVLRAVNSIDAMTAEWATLPYDFLAKVSNEIILNVKGVNRVVYDISSKPPATIEWE